MPKTSRTRALILVALIASAFLMVSRAATAAFGQVSPDAPAAPLLPVADIQVAGEGLTGKTIVLDPGHGGPDWGAVGQNGLAEKDVNLDIALGLEQLLEADGATVIMTRESDELCAAPEEFASVDDPIHFDLDCRLAKAGGADLFISIHNNANPSTRESGTETYWSSENPQQDQSQALASLIQGELVGALGTDDRTVMDDDYYVLRNAEVPAALVEVAFISNPDEEALLEQGAFRQGAAEAIFAACQQYFAGEGR